MKKRFTDEQIIGILREAEVGAMSIKALCKKHGNPPAFSGLQKWS